MDTSMATSDDQMETSVTGSTGAASSVRTGKGAKSSSTRMVSSKFMQAAAAPPTGHRQDVNGRDSFHLRAGGSMGYASVAATPAHAMNAGRSLHLPSTVKPSGILASRHLGLRDSQHHLGISPGAGTTAFSSVSAAAPMHLSNAFNAAAQDRRREQLEKYKQEKAAARAGVTGAAAAAPPGQAVNASGTGGGAPRVPPLALGILREGAQAPGEGNRSARNGGVYGGSGGSTAQLSGRGGQGQNARLQAPARPSGAPAGGTSNRGGGAAANPAKAPPVPRMAAVPPPVIVEQQLRTAVNAPLPKDEVWEAAQVALPADGFEEGAAGHASAKTPSSRITKSPRIVAQGGGAGATWAAQGQMLPMAPPPAPGAPVQPQQQQYAPVPPRSPPPPSSRGMPSGTQAVGPSAASSMAMDTNSGRLTSNAEASTSDTGGRSIRDQIKMAKLQELQWRVLKAKLDTAARARIDKGQRQMAACSLLLTDMMGHSIANSAALATAEALKRTQHVLATQLPLLEQWKELQDTHGPATREVLTALQNAMTNLPLVNGAALGMGGGDITQALPQLRRAIANGLGSLQSAEVALGVLLHGVNMRSSSSGSGSAAETRGGQAQAGQGGVIAMATLLPQLYDTLVGEVANLRTLLSNLNTLAAKLDEAACLRARTAAAALSAPWSSHEPGCGGLWVEGPVDVSSDSSTADNTLLMDKALAMLGLGIGAV